MIKLILIWLNFLSLALAQGVTVWTQFEGSDLEWLQSEADSFKATLGIPVQITSLSLGEIKQQILLEEEVSVAADLFLPITHNEIDAMVSAGALANMNIYATQEYLEDLSKQARLAFVFDGNLFGLPMYVEGPALIINTSLVPQLPDTFEGFIETAKALTDGDNYGFLYDISNFYFSYTWLSGYGGYVFARDKNNNLSPKDIGLANEGAIKGGGIVQDLRHKHNILPEEIDYAAADKLFFDGQLAMTYNGPWAINNYQIAGLSVAVGPLPHTQEGGSFSGFMSVQGVLVNEFSENKIVAVNFAKWLTRPAAQISLAERSGKVPASQEAVSRVRANDPIVAGFADALADSTPIPNIPEMGKVWGPMDEALKVILASPDSDVAGALNRAVKAIAE